MLLLQRLESISGLNLLDSSLHSECVVTSSLVLQDSSKIECRTLADTGCTQQCFMSEGHFNKYPILQQYLVQHPTNTINLATLGSTAVVSKHISVVLEIVHRGTPIRCKVIIGIMKGLRYDLVLSLVVIASHYIDVLVDLLNVQLRQPSPTPNVSLSMMAVHDASHITDLPPIHPQALSNWKADNYRQQLYVLEPVFLPRLTMFSKIITLGQAPLKTSNTRSILPLVSFTSLIFIGSVFISKLVPS